MQIEHSITLIVISLSFSSYEAAKLHVDYQVTSTAHRLITWCVAW